MDLNKRTAKSNTRRLSKRCRAFVIVMIFALVQIIPSFVFAADSGDITGSFAAKAPPTVDLVEVKTAAAEATVTGGIVTTATLAGIDFSGGGLLSFTLNGTTIILNSTYATAVLVAAAIQTQLTTEGNSTVTVSAVDEVPGTSERLILSGAAAQDIVIAAGNGALTQIGLTAGTEPAVTGDATAFNPSSTYNVEVTVTESDGFGAANGGLDTLVTKLWYDGSVDGEDSLEAYFLLKNTASTTGCVIISWDAATNLATISSGAETSWVLGASTLPATGDLATLTTFKFVFPITVGEIANITTGNQMWQVGARVKDLDTSTSYKELGFGATVGLPMNWYGKIIVPQDTVADWGRVDAGLDYATDAEAEIRIQGLEFLSNGTYYERVKASDVWNADGGLTANIKATPAIANDFTIAAANINPVAVGPDAGTHKVLPIANASIAIAQSYNAHTTYTTNAVDNYLYLSLYSDFDKGAVFTGTITYLISNSAL